jgi:cellulose biosynthesis protein BcsQ
MANPPFSLRGSRQTKTGTEKMKVVSFSIFKGGTGKTISTVSTAAALVNKGKKVLIVDLDQQASATRYLDLDPEHSPNLYEVFTGTKPAQLAIKKTKANIDVIASHVLMAAIEEALEPGDELRLSELLTPLKPSYDFILIDNPPGKAMLAFNGLAAADLIVIPASAERMAVDGVADLINHVQKIMWSKFSHIPSDLVVDQWVSNVESSSPRDFLFLHDLWTTFRHLLWSQMTSTISTAWDFTTKSGGIWKKKEMH